MRSLELGTLPLINYPDGIAYGALPLPSFFLQAKASPLHFLHGSCRLLHGKGEDALAAADAATARHAEDIASRPSVLYLTGDQIYGDDVAGPLIEHLSRLGRELMGDGDDTSVPGIIRLSAVGIYGRQKLADAAKLTSDTAGNHLFTFGEFAAVYTVAFSWKDKRLPITQLVSSAQKHAGVLSKTALNLVGKIVPNTHERIGWDRPPRSAHSTAIQRRLRRPTHTDEWSEDAPVFLTPRRARRLGITEPPDYREQRQYVPASGLRTLTILGDNNVGLVSITGDEVIHQLLCQTGGEVRIYTATMQMRPTTPRAYQQRPDANAAGTV